MAGLMSKMGAERPASDAAGNVPSNAMAEPPPEDGDDAQPNVSPEEQAIYDQFVDNALKVIFGRQTAPSILKRLQSSGSLVEGLASATVKVVDAVRTSAEKSGAKIPDEVLFHAGFEILDNIATLAEAARIHKFTEDEMEQAVYIALDMYATMELEQGRINPEEAISDFKALVEADRAGKVDEVIPGLSAAAERIKAKGGGKAAAEDMKRRA